MSASSSRTPRAVALTLVLVVLTMAFAPATASARGAALTPPSTQVAPRAPASVRLTAPVPGTTCSRPQATALTVDSDLRVPSNLSAWAIDRFLALATPLPPLGAAFKLAEARYRVNALYLLAHAMLESNFGRSYIAQSFHNLFGWTAYDRDPVAFATRFPDFAASVDYVAMRISETYLDPDGVHYGGAPTLRGMYRYASDPQWEASIARIANSLCLPTLAGAGIAFTSRLAASELKPGESTELTIEATPPSVLPDGLRLGARARVQGDGPGRNDLATYALTSAVSEGGAFQLPVEAGARPGAYVLDFVLLDSDGGVLPTTDQVAIPTVSLAVVARQAIAYTVNQTAIGLFVSIESVGDDAIAAGGDSGTAELEVRYQSAGSGETGASVPATPSVLARIALTGPLGPGESRGFQLPPDIRLDLPGTLFVRLIAEDADGARIDLTSGAFRLTRDTHSVGAGANGTLVDEVLVITPLETELPNTAGPDSPGSPEEGPAD